MFAYGDNPRHDLTPEQQKDLDEYYRQYEQQQKRRITDQGPEVEPQKDDNEIPFA
jgi:hypothetical protein